LSELLDAQQAVSVFEGARFHQQRFETYGDRLGQIATVVRDGLQIAETRYEESRQSIARGRARMAEIFETTPVILVPAATGPAPRGLSYTGDASMNAPWTALGTPAISLPMPVAAGLPLGLQLTAAPSQDARVLQTAVRLHRILKSQIT
jgi:Asp-tRNA(Asn)/Glu-tRNA(Gln) amidotransferase A subunit family amidase